MKLTKLSKANKFINKKLVIEKSRENMFRDIKESI